MPKIPALILLAAHLALSGCGSGVQSEPGNVDGDIDGDNADAASGADGSPEVPDCDEGEGLLLSGTFNHTSLTAEPWLHEGGGEDRIIGFIGTLESGDEFSFRRDGDSSDGGIDEIATYDVSTYPYNFQFLKGAALSECETGGESGGPCGGFYALGGTFTVTQLTPNYEATFTFTALHEGGGEDPGASIAGEINGCLSVPN